MTGVSRELLERCAVPALVVALAVALLASAAAYAQRSSADLGSSSAAPQSELARDNLNLVAASEQQIAAVLDKNPGLMVELKRWVAQDAADRGQILVDSDLSDDQILARLTQDQKFRASATRLLQRYGFFLPKTNPDSPAGREQDAIETERIRRIVRGGEGERAAAPCSDSGASPRAACAQTPQRGAAAPNALNPPAFPADRDLNQMLGNPLGPLGPAGPLVPSGPVAPPAGSPLRTASATTGAGARGDFAGSGEAGADPDLVAFNDDPPGERSDLREADPRRTAVAAASVPATSALDQGDRDQGDRNRSDGAQRRAVNLKAPMETEPPRLPAQAGPYSDIPSLYDMFVQSVERTDQVRRFGEEIFQNAPQSAGAIPIDFPASPDYVVGPGDGLTVDLWGGISQRLLRTVDHEGRIELPEIGPVLVSGQSLGQLQEAVQRLLRTQFRDVSADVSLSRLRTVRIYVVGDVAHPGAYDVSSLSTPLNALLAAGGPTSTGSLRTVQHLRGDALVQQVDLYDLLLRGVRDGLQRLEPGDTLLVPPAGAEVRLNGMVRRPAVYELREETTLAQALALAGGILPAAALSHIEVDRLEAHAKRTMLSLDVSSAANPQEIETQLASFVVRDQDEVHIFPIATFNQDAVYLEGHVLRAGRYSYQAGMKLTDVISSFGDLLPEPAAHYAEIIRLNPPDHHPSVESFDLAEALANPAAAPKLQPLDTVRIFGRFDFENAPSVTVSGAVRRPGTYQTSGQIHFRDAVELAGGATPDASMESAQIIRVTPDSSLRILSINLGQALHGDPLHSVLLEPRDRILLQQNIARSDPPSVLVGGEVVNPGRYGLTSNLHLSDLIRIAGGLKRSADTDTADMTEFVTSANAPLVATHRDVNLAKAMGGDAGQDLVLHDGDVLTVRQVPGWNDLGAAVHLEGEVKHPGTYGIRPGERLSSVLKRAGGFEATAYPYGAILERNEVRDSEAREHDAMILRVKEAQNGLQLLPEADPQQKAAKQLAIEQWQSSLDQLDANPPVGRVSIHVSATSDRWQNSSADIEMRAGDTIIIPKRPGYVMVAGQVFNPTAVTYQAGRSAFWYLSQAGGPTPLANKRAIFVVRADGSVIGERKGLWTGDTLGTALQPGDTVMVPEKALAGNVPWQNILLSAQVASAVASTVFIALRY